MTHTDRLITELQKLKENQLTTDILIPLLKKLGYKKVEFYGGQSEAGKDIVIWDEDKFEDIKLTVAQVKKFKFTNKASDNRSLQTIVNQLITCTTKKIIYTDQKAYYPSELLLISPYSIDTKTLLTRFDSEPHLKDQSLKIIDANKLASLLLKHQPDVVKDLLGLEYEISSKLEPRFNNDILLKALGRRNIKDIKTIYSDIDFSIGKLTTNLFFNSTFNSKDETIELTHEEWITFKNIILQVSKEFSQEFLYKNIEEIEQEHYSVRNAYLKTSKEIEIYNNEIIELKKNIDCSNKERNNWIKEFESVESEINQFKLNNKESDEITKEERVLKQREYKTLEQRLLKTNHKLNTVKSHIDKNEKLIENRLNKIHTSLEELSTIRYTVKINGKKIAEEIINKRKWVESKVLEYNNQTPSSSILKSFIQRCDSIINLVAFFFKSENQKFFNCIGVDKNSFIRNNFESTRFKLPIDKFFDTGLNITVLGDAGAGKSTSLEMYAWNQKDSEKIVLLFPLGNIVQYNPLRSNEINQINETDNLENIFFLYLNRMGIQISNSEFIYLLKNNKFILLLDGLDEAIKIAPILPEAIHIFSEKYKNVQIILSSRMYGSYLEKIPFFTVTLLPFTEDQRNIFIEKWFENESDNVQITNKIKKHLIENKAISDIVRNPLLTTTLCVLAEHKLTLPRTEIKLYDERLRLFSGYYDNVKHIVTRISSTPQTLELLAQKLAFFLHNENTREEELEILKEKSIRLLANQIEKESIENAFVELMDPCEILLPMTSDGKYGFGHLRYQEHLAARELMRRSINIIPMLSQDWWHGPLILFARMNENLEWLIKLIGDNGLISLPIVNEIIDTRNSQEKDNLRSLVDQYLNLKNECISYTNFPIDGIDHFEDFEDFEDFEGFEEN